MRNRFALSVLIVVSLLTVSGCDDLTERDETVTVTLDSFNLEGNGSNAFSRANFSGNPACTESPTSLNDLLDQANIDSDVREYLDTLRINQIQYRITRNSTSEPIIGTMQMTDSATEGLTTVARVDIPGNGIVADWTLFPFIDNGANIAQHYLSNLDAQFTYCAEGSPNYSDLSLTLELRFNMIVTVDLI